MRRSLSALFAATAILITGAGNVAASPARLSPRQLLVASIYHSVAAGTAHGQGRFAILMGGSYRLTYGYAFQALHIGTNLELPTFTVHDRRAWPAP